MTENLKCRITVEIAEERAKEALARGAESQKTQIDVFREFYEHQREIFKKDAEKIWGIKTDESKSG